MTIDFDVQQLYRTLSDYSELKSGRAPLFTKRERIFLYVTLGSFIFAILSALVGRYFPLHREPFQVVALLLALITQLFALLAMVANLWPSISLVKHFVTRPVRTFLIPLSTKTQSDHDFAKELAIYADDSLKFVAKRLRGEADHLRSRLGMLFGAIDKAGAVPLFLTIIATVWNLSKGFPIPLKVLIPIIGALLVSYALLAAMFLMSHRLEELAQMVELAVDIRTRNHSNFSSEEHRVQTE